MSTALPRVDMTPLVIQAHSLEEQAYTLLPMQNRTINPAERTRAPKAEYARTIAPRGSKAAALLAKADRLYWQVVTEYHAPISLLAYRIKLRYKLKDEQEDIAQWARLGWYRGCMAWQPTVRLSTVCFTWATQAIQRGLFESADVKPSGKQRISWAATKIVPVEKADNIPTDDARIIEEMHLAQRKIAVTEAIETLSPLRQRILALHMAEVNNREIAAQLNVSHQRITQQLKDIYDHIHAVTERYK